MYKLPKDLQKMVAFSKFCIKTGLDPYLVVQLVLIYRRSETTKSQQQYDNLRTKFAEICDKLGINDDWRGPVKLTVPYKGVYRLQDIGI